MNIIQSASSFKRCAGVETLVRVFKNQLQNLNPIYFDARNIINIAKFNVRNLKKTNKQNIDIICMQEHKYCYSEVLKYDDTGNGWHFSRYLHGKSPSMQPKDV